MDLLTNLDSFYTDSYILGKVESSTSLRQLKTSVSPVLVDLSHLCIYNVFKLETD